MEVATRLFECYNMNRCSSAGHLITYLSPCSTFLNVLDVTSESAYVIGFDMNRQ